MLTPELLINIALVASAGLLALFFIIVLTAPYPGFVLQAQENSNSWEVTQLDSWVQQQGLSLGNQVAGIAPRGGTTLLLEYYHIPNLSTESAIKDLDRDERARKLAEVYDILSQPEIEVVLSDGNRIDLTLDHQRPLSSIPIPIWFELVIAISAPLIGALVWVWQTKQLETILLLLSGVGFFLFAFPSAASIYAIDMLYFPTYLFWLLRSGVDVGQSLFYGGAICVLLYYPTKLAIADLWCKRVFIGLFAFAVIAFLSSWKLLTGLNNFSIFQIQQNFY